MDKYIVVTTLCNNKDIANKIINTLLEKKLVAGAQLSTVYSKYWWNDKLEECEEYKIEKMKLILIYINDSIQFIFLTLKN